MKIHEYQAKRLLAEVEAASGRFSGNAARARVYEDAPEKQA